MPTADYLPNDFLQGLSSPELQEEIAKARRFVKKYSLKYPFKVSHKCRYACTITHDTVFIDPEMVKIMIDKYAPSSDNENDDAPLR